MRILAAADLHGDHTVYDWLVSTAAAQRPDAVVLAGDLLGVPDGFDTVEIAQRVSRDHVIGHLARVEAPVLYVMGNDDWLDLGGRDPYLCPLHGRRLDLGGVNFVGYQYTLPFMGGVNEKPEAAMEADLAELEPHLDEATILVTHGPAHGVLDRGVLDRHAGSVALAELLSRRPFRAHIHGHVHRDFGRHERHFNVASAGRKRAMLIDVRTMKHEVLGGHTQGDHS